MKSRGWNSADLSRNTNVPPIVISRMFSGSVNIKLESLNKIIDCLSLLKSSEKSEESFSTSDPELVDACEMLEKIYKNSVKHKKALHENLTSFSEIIDQMNAAEEDERTRAEERERIKNTLAAIEERNQAIIGEYKNTMSFLSALRIKHPFMFVDPADHKQATDPPPDNIKPFKKPPKPDKKK